MRITGIDVKFRKELGQYRLKANITFAQQRAVTCDVCVGAEELDRQLTYARTVRAFLNILEARLLSAVSPYEERRKVYRSTHVGE